MLEFKPLTLEDCEFLQEVRNEYAETYLHNSTTYSIEETKEWYKKLNIPYYVVYYQDNRIGYFRLSDYSPQNNNMFIGMDIHKNFKGKGYAYEAYIKFIPYIMDKYNLNKISLEVLSTNTVAINLYKKLGFITEGVKRQEVLKNGKYIDSILMSLLREEV
jgi:RimJ/RimL family protein N-acetyltransferase